MKLKLLSAAALSLALMSGAALAQNTSSTNPTEATNAPGNPLLGNTEMMGAFYTDDTMGTLRSDEELRTAWSGLSEENRAAITEECKDQPGSSDGSNTALDQLNPNTPAFCAKVGSF